ncbi:XRE family transcriptional regulator, partial [Bacteroides ovatus]
ISQRALAEKTGFVYSTIVKIESKKSIISIDTMLKIVDVLGYTVKIEK